MATCRNGIFVESFFVESSDHRPPVGARSCLHWQCLFPDAKKWRIVRRMGAGAVAKTLEEKLTAAFEPAHLELENESHQHAVPEGAESHFRAVIVSAAFAGVSRIERQRQVLAAIDYELKNGVHAFTMRALTPEEWQAGQGAGFQSPACMGGSKADR